MRRYLLSFVVLSAVVFPRTAAADEQAAAVSLSAPGMFGPLALNPEPLNFTAGSFGKIYVSGVTSGLALWQSHHVPGDRTGWTDLDNAQIVVQKIDGPLQFYCSE